MGDGRRAAVVEDFFGRAVADCLDHNPLSGSPSDLGRPGRAALALWSGWAEAGDDAGVATWGPAGWDAFNRWCDGAAREAERAGVALWLRPRASHVLCDAQRCLTFLRAREGGPVRLLLDPEGLLAPSMLRDAADHVERIMLALADHPGVAALYLPSAASCRLAPPASGALRELAQRLWPSQKPIVLGGADAPARAPEHTP